MTNLPRAVTLAGVLSLAAFAVSGCAIVRGVPQAAAGGVRQLQLAAEQGYVRAQFNLALSYDTGTGVRQDSVEAAPLVPGKAPVDQADQQITITQADTVHLP